MRHAHYNNKKTYQAKQALGQGLLSKIIIINNKVGHSIVIKTAVHQEDILKLNINIPNKIALIYKQQKTISSKGEIEKSTVKLTDFQLLVGQPDKQLSKYILDLNNIINLNQFTFKESAP